MKEAQKKWVRKNCMTAFERVGEKVPNEVNEAIKKTLAVKYPPHYPKDNDVIKFCADNDIPFAEGNVIKYVVRWRKKNGLEDLMKAKEYLERIIKLENNG